MKGVGKMSTLLVSGAFLLVGAASADPDRNPDRSRVILEQQKSRDCSYNRNCRALGPQADRRDRNGDGRTYNNDDRNNNNNRRDNDRRQDWDQDRDRQQQWDRYRDHNRQQQWGWDRNRQQQWDRDRNRQQHWDRDRDRQHQWDRDRNRHQWDRNHNVTRPRIEFRISSYPLYIDSGRRSRFVHRGPIYWGPVYHYRPGNYYYRESGFPGYVDRFPNAPDNSRIMWNDDRRLTTQETDEYCREYYTDAGVSGRTQQVYGTACLQPDGSWEIKN